MDEDAAKPAPADETPPAKEDETTAPAEESARKPMEKATAEPAPTDESAPAAGEDEPMAAGGQLLKKPDDDISDLVSDRGTATAREDESAAPSEDMAERSAEAADETAAEAEPSPAAMDEAPAPSARPATTGKDDATAPAKTSEELRGTEETRAPRETITIRELLEGTVEVDEHDVFYVHAVTPEDRQGLWGIIQKGVTETFARGVRLTIEGRTDTYRVAVPPDADEVLEDRSSSPFGLMIHRKSRETIVYNRERGRLTLDPDVTLYPGNELIIVGFKPKELINLYKHFAGPDGG